MEGVEGEVRGLLQRRQGSRCPERVQMMTRSD